MSYQIGRSSLVEDHAAGSTTRELLRRVDTEERVTTRPAGTTVAARLVTLLFGLVQLVIALRIVLLAFDARQGNDIVTTILTISGVFVAPFEGILQTDAMSASGAILDIAAVVALVGWTIVELIALQVIRIGSPRPDA